MDANSIGRVGFLFTLLLAALPASPARAARASAGGFDGYGFVSSYYDNNVFSYSDQDRRLYESGDPAFGKFPIEDLADFVTTLALRGDYRWGVDGRSMWRARLLYDGNFYARNTERTYHQFGVSLERSLRHAGIDVDVSYTPDYYLRHLYWRPMPERPLGVRYAAARYDRFEVEVDGHRRLVRKVDGRLTLGFARRNYDFPFDERDNNTYSLGAGVSVAAHPRFDVSMLLKVDLSRASGADSLNPDVDDVSNNRFGFEADGTWRIYRWMRFSQSLDYGHQVYTSDKITDVSHHDRTDDELEGKSTLRFGSFDGWQPEVFFLFRTSSTSIPAGVAEFGQYDALRWGTQVTYYF